MLVENDDGSKWLAPGTLAGLQTMRRDYGPCDEEGNPAWKGGLDEVWEYDETDEEWHARKAAEQAARDSREMADWLEENGFNVGDDDEKLRDEDDEAMRKLDAFLFRHESVPKGKLVLEDVVPEDQIPFVLAPSPAEKPVSSKYKNQRVEVRLERTELKPLELAIETLTKRLEKYEDVLVESKPPKQKKKKPAASKKEPKPSFGKCPSPCGVDITFKGGKLCAKCHWAQKEEKKEPPKLQHQLKPEGAHAQCIPDYEHVRCLDENGDHIYYALPIAEWLVFPQHDLHRIKYLVPPSRDDEPEFRIEVNLLTVPSMLRYMCKKVDVGMGAVKSIPAKRIAGTEEVQQAVQAHFVRPDIRNKISNGPILLRTDECFEARYYSEVGDCGLPVWLEMPTGQYYIGGLHEGEVTGRHCNRAMLVDIPLN